MAREYARYLASTHRDDDWHALTTTQHDCYMALLSSSDITWAGVVPYVPSRFAGLAADLNERKVIRTWDELDRLGLLVIDKQTAEVLVRTFLRHDNVLAKPNIARAFCKALPNVRSARILGALDRELRKLYNDNPDLSGWEPFSEQFPELFDQLLGGTVS